MASKRLSRIKSAMNASKSNKQQMKSVLAKMSSTDANSRANPEGKAGYRIPYQEDTNRSPYKRGPRASRPRRNRRPRYEYGRVTKQDRIT